MQYNLLYYGTNYDDCNQTTNPVEQKEQYLRTIVNYYKPDILSCNELGKNEAVSNRLLDSVFNYNDSSIYAKANISNVSNSNIINMLFYNTNKLGLLSQTSIKTDYRDITIHKLYYKTNNYCWNNDTAFIHCISVHLKAGNTEAAARKVMVDSLIKYLNYLSKVPENMILIGDLNVYGASEPAFQALINNTNLNIRFYDPVNQIGEWHDNINYKYYHTQSTRTSGNGCYTTGGFDDRFDFILTSSDILNGPYKYVKYIPNSYKIPGQDGQRFKKSLINPANYSAPSNIITAMYELSDHLPVFLDLLVAPNVGILNYTNNNSINLITPNPIKNNEHIKLQINADGNSKAIIQLFNITGNKLLEYNVNINKGNQIVDIIYEKLTQGIYLLKFIDTNNLFSQTIKIIII